MKFFISALILFFGLNTFAQSHDHSETICDTVQTDLCVHLGIHEKLNTSDAGKFMVHFLVDSATASKIQNLSVVLWMDMGHGHGHGTAPVTITPKSPGVYLVSEAYFIMEGPWIVKVGFDLDGTHHELQVPLIIE